MAKIIPEVSHPTSVCPHPELWHCYDDQATEIEVLDFLTALVVMLKPRIIIETGCWLGFGTERLVQGAIQNGFGHVYTCDIAHDKVLDARERLTAVSDWVTVKHCTGLELIAEVPTPIDFAFLDSGPDMVRCHELCAVTPKLATEGIVAVHDVGVQGWLRYYFTETVRNLALQHFIFTTPRGLGLARKKPRQGSIPPVTT
jgi:predicted O-methyltransferase YrrM